MKNERLERVASGPARDDLLPLFLVADDSVTQVASYYQDGDLFVLRGSDGAARGIVLVVPTADQTVELKAVAVRQGLHGQGVGKRMLALVLGELRGAGARRVTVGTANCGIGQLAFYQKCGFRFWKIERDFFNPARGYPEGIVENGIPLRDMVWMDLTLWPERSRSATAADDQVRVAELVPQVPAAPRL